LLTFKPLTWQNFIGEWTSSQTKTDVARAFNFTSMEAVNDYAHIVNNRLKNDNVQLPMLQDYTKYEKSKLDVERLKESLRGSKIPKGLLDGLVRLNPST
jgi:hypothetical protein